MGTALAVLPLALTPPLGCIPGPAVNDTLPLDVVFDDDPNSETIATLSQPGQQFGAVFFGTKTTDGNVTTITGLTGQTEDGTPFSAELSDALPTELEIDGDVYTFTASGPSAFDVTIAPAGASAGQTADADVAVNRLIEGDRALSRLSLQRADCAACPEQNDLSVLESGATLFVYALSTHVTACIQSDAAGAEQCAGLQAVVNALARIFNAFLAAGDDLPEDVQSIHFDDDGIEWPDAADWPAAEDAADVCTAADFPNDDGVTLAATGGLYTAGRDGGLQDQIYLNETATFTIDPTSSFLTDGTELHWAVSGQEIDVIPQFAAAQPDSALVAAAAFGSVELCVWGTDPTTGEVVFKAGRSLAVQPRTFRVTGVSVAGGPFRADDNEPYTLCLTYVGTLPLPGRIGVIPPNCSGASCTPTLWSINAARDGRACAGVTPACTGAVVATTVNLIAFIQDPTGAESASFSFSYTCEPAP
jgi:hypothetical protein